jgi:hypothetical protein
MTTTNLGMTLPTVGADADTWGNELNTDLGLIDAFAGSLMPQGEVTVASAATTDIGAAASTAVAISGTVTITSFGTGANKIRFARFTGALTLTHNATSLILLGGANHATAAGDTGIYKSDGSGNWREMAFCSSAYNPSLHTGTGAFAHVANPTFTGTVNFAALSGSGSIVTTGGNLNVNTVGGSVNSAGGGFTDQGTSGGYTTSGFGEHTTMSISEIGYTYGGWGGFVNISDGRAKTVLADRIDYRAAVKNLFVCDFLQYDNFDKTGVAHPGFGVIAQQAFTQLGRFGGIRQPENDGGAWKATQEPWAFLALKVLSGALKEIDDLKAQIAAPQAGT